jgi:hypothetical protein
MDDFRAMFFGHCVPILVGGFVVLGIVFLVISGVLERKN